jgi:hypothetical protein
MHARSSGMSTHGVLTSIVAAVSSWRLLTRPAVAERAAYAVAEEGVGGLQGAGGGSGASGAAGGAAGAPPLQWTSDACGAEDGGSVFCVVCAHVCLRPRSGRRPARAGPHASYAAALGAPG